MVTYKSRSGVRRFIIKNDLIPYVCAICSQEPFWQEKPMTLILDHINGVNDDHRLENLRFVCPNCDIQLETYGARNSKPRPKKEKRKKTYLCDLCGQMRKYSSRSKSCRECAKYHRPDIVWPDVATLLIMVQELGYQGTGKTLGITDNAVRKHLTKKERSHVEVDKDARSKKSED